MKTDDVARAARAAGLSCQQLDARRYPSLSWLATRSPTRYPFLLESSAGSAAQSRFDLLLAFPGDYLTDQDFDTPAAFFDAIDERAAVEAAPSVPGLPFIGGWFIYLGYEMAEGVEPSLSLPASDEPFPNALAVRCPAAIVLDRKLQTLYLVAEKNDDAKVRQMQADLDAAMAADAPVPTPLVARWNEQSPEHYRQAVARARDYIQAGDVFQANLARVWEGELAAPVDASTIYAGLKTANPAPFSGLIQWQGSALISSSPERLLSIDDRQASVRPIAGTRRRTPGSDATVTQELITHPKERAEHVMLIDLVRNDLGRVCMPGTVTVDELMVVESYAHVHHIVSNVTGRLQSSIGPGGALKAVFPGGTITGCPKVRCMEIIAELEAVGRGAYTGSFGYLSRCGQLDTNIVIRSLMQQGTRLTLRTGAGIVADSDPQAELEETRHKARGVLRAFVDEQGQAHG